MSRNDQPRHLRELLDRLSSDAAVLDEFKKDPITVLAGLSSRDKSPIHSDTLIYRWVVISLALVILVIVGAELFIHVNAVIVAPDKEHKVPDFLISVCSTALGALAGLLAPIPINRGQ